MIEPVPALPFPRFLRSVDASRATLGKPPMKLLDVVAHVRLLTEDAPYAVVGGLAQILWARKTHTDDLDIVLTSPSLDAAVARVVDLLAFRDVAFQSEILATARAVPELGGIRFISPELLLVTQLLRPGPNAALAALELVLARTPLPPFDLDYVRQWARRVDREAGLDRTLQRASTFT